MMTLDLDFFLGSAELRYIKGDAVLQPHKFTNYIVIVNNSVGQ